MEEKTEDKTESANRDFRSDVRARDKDSRVQHVDIM